MSQSRPPSLLDRLRRFDPAVLPILVAGLVLVGAVLWLLGRPLPSPSTNTPDPQLAALRGEVERLQVLTGRVAALEARPQPQMPDLAPLREAIAAANGQAQALEQRVEAVARDLAARPQVNPDSFASRDALGQLATRIEGVQRDLQAAAGRIETMQRDLQAAYTQLAQRQSVAEGALGALTGRLAAAEAALAARGQAIEQLVSRMGQGEQALAARIAALESQLQQRAAAIEAQAGRIAALEGTAQRLAALEGRAARMAALDQVRNALEAGQPLGGALAPLANVPPALSRFATTPPPTEAQLRLGFEEAARAGRAASEPQGATSVMESAAQRLQGLITVRRGEEILVGDAAGAEIEKARRAVEAGDLEAALRLLSRLSPPARQAMAGWIEQAEALVAARQAIRQMAAG